MASAETTAISPSCSTTTSRVYSSTAGMSLATMFSPTPAPMMSGESLRAAMIMSG